ncbi:MAG: HD domain-containing protein [Deltaproteobacteria bacterium]|uniref:HD-GYP domain-containing protein n=1 Tax=Hydrosulfovibrio ferrireducens TaxID=2934181 RepID=UPI00122C0A99|nr:MAG: HD domain-containing protein [Deltaproteobacteria bacterium]
MLAESKKYIRIATDYLLAEDRRKIDFNIYTKPPKSNKPILLIAANTNIADIKEALAKKSHGPLFITQDSAQKFENFMEESLDSIIRNTDIPLEHKSSLVHTCAKNIIRDVFDDPRSGRHISRAKNITSNIIDLTLLDTQSIRHLLRLGAKDYYTFSHCVNVAVFGIGLWLMIRKGDDTELHDFALGCILHDVGKSQILDTILNKRGKLDYEEFEIIKKHPGQGHWLMAKHTSETTLDVIIHHHEKINGQGYPHGLKRDQISDNAKIATIADVYDALTTNRPYAGARLPISALTLMKEEMVGHFEQKRFEEFILFLGGRSA